jgi:hypothetical protein
MKLYVTSDGWPAYLHADGTMTDSPEKSASDLGWDSLEQLLKWDPDTREGTQEEWAYYENIRKQHSEWIATLNL